MLLQKVWIMSDDSDIYLCLAAIFRDPFHGGDNILVLTETYNNDGMPNCNNHHHFAKKSMDLVKDTAPWFSLEQEYTLFDIDGQRWMGPKMGLHHLQKQKHGRKQNAPFLHRTYVK